MNQEEFKKKVTELKDQDFLRFANESNNLKKEDREIMLGLVIGFFESMKRNNADVEENFMILLSLLEIANIIKINEDIFIK